ncbi:MAG: ATP-NAD kinase family protein [Halieaceae bacterium]
MTSALHIGLIVNPLAGLGGALALKGSDGEALRQRVSELQPEQKRRAAQRVERALAMLLSRQAEVSFTAWSGPMGGDALKQAGFSATVLNDTGESLSTADDTRRAAEAMLEQEVDLLVFAGGDGTARDIFDAVGSDFPVLGIPCGVKMHSGVFAVSPEAAGELLLQLLAGGLVGLQLREVRDIDEDAFRQDVVKARFYGEMLVPAQGQYLQQTKIGGRESPDLVAADIADWMSESFDPETLYLFGPGSTTAGIMASLGLPGTLLGVDVVRNNEVLVNDADEETLLQLLSEHTGKAEILVTAIGGQGHIFGRGNQQFSPAVIRAVGIDNITVVAAKSKISGLEGRPLFVDTNDPALDKVLSGYRQVLTGYDDHVLYRVASA